MSAPPHDDPNIIDEHKVIRRINPIYHVVDDHNRNVRRISTKAYNKSSGPTEGMSVDLEHSIQSADLNPLLYVVDPTFVGAVYFAAGFLRSQGLWVGSDPIPDNQHHGQAWLPLEKKSFSNQQTRSLADNAEWYVQIAEVELR